MKRTAVADDAQPPATSERTAWPSVSAFSRYAHPGERVILRGGGNSAPGTTASTRTVRLYKTARSPQVCPAHRRHRRRLGTTSGRQHSSQSSSSCSSSRDGEVQGRHGPGGGRGGSNNWQGGPCLKAGPDGKGRKAECGGSTFVDTSKSVRLTDAPQPGTVSQALFVGELCQRECAELDHTGRTTVTAKNSVISSLVRARERDESKNINPRQIDCGDGHLPDLDCSQLEQNSSNS